MIYNQNIINVLTQHAIIVRMRNSPKFTLDYLLSCYSNAAVTLLYSSAYLDNVKFHAY